MNFTTDDGYTIQEGSKIHYTGDQANCGGNFTVTKIEPCSFYGMKVTLQEDPGEYSEGRKETLTPTNFDSGPGRRFEPMELMARRRNEVLKRFQAAANK